MKRTMLALSVASSVVAALIVPVTTAEAAPGGCLKYGAAGAAAGHVAGGHAVRGFMAGCAAGMYRRHLYNKQMREQRRQQMAPAGSST